MIIDIVSDVICPWCFIGKRRLERPFQLNPDMPPEGMDRAAYLQAKFGAAGGGSVYEKVIAAGAGDGISFAFDRIRRTPNTIKAHRLIRRAAEAGTQDAMVEALFRAYFQEGADLGDDDELARIAQGAGFVPDDTVAYLASDRDEADIRAEDAFAREVGIGGVPCFIVDRKFALSGAQAPEAFLEVFELARRESETPTPDQV
jgi:predicted DsbA family dithiol-disulfide isomerase